MARLPKVLVLFSVLLFLFPLALAVHDQEIYCDSFFSCDDVCPDLGTECYCGVDNICYGVNEGEGDSEVSVTSNTTSRNTTTAISSATTTPAVNQTALLQLDQRVKALENKTKALETKSASLDKALAAVKSDVSTLQQQVAQLGGNLKQQLDQLSSSLEGLTSEQTQLSTGLAGLQENIDSAQQNLASLQEDVERRQAFTRMIIALILVVAVILLALGVVYFITRKSKHEKEGKAEVEPEVLHYITSHIKQGKKYPHIRENLLQAGWGEEDINTAYRATMKQNYTTYMKSKTSSSGGLDKNKVLAIGVVSLLLVVGAFFLIQGVTTGKAIEFQTPELFEAAVEANLKSFVANNQFYPLLSKGTLCVQIQDGTKSLSYRIIKTPQKHAVAKAPLPCVQDGEHYDAAVEFMSWQSFNVISRRMNCETFRNQHKRGFYVLPSKYVAPGFTLVAGKDVTPFCPVLLQCLTSAQLASAGIQCEGGETETVAVARPPR